MLVQSRGGRKSLPAETLEGIMGHASKYSRAMKSCSRLYSVSTRNVFFILLFFLLSSCLVSQYNAGVDLFFQKSVAHVHTFQPASIHDPVTGAEYVPDVDSAKPSTSTTAADKTNDAQQAVPSEKKKDPVAVTKATVESKTTIAAPPPKSEKSLAEVLHFSDKTSLNFMHFHKTGGVSYKIALYTFFNGKTKGNGDAVRCKDACYNAATPPVHQWRCDWEPVWAMNETERNKLDAVFGHQFWLHGAQDFLNKRDMRTFTVIRHPFDRKVSFFFHFFVREANRDEASITFEEVRDFLLYEKSRDNIDLFRDLGPNYMAGRLLSDGKQGFVGDARYSYFDVKKEDEEKVVEKALNIMKSYVFVGLQMENPASKCMLRKTVEAFNAVHGIDNSGTEEVTKKSTKANSGSYSLTAPKIWAQMSTEDRKLFNHKERVDLAIYYAGERMFQQQVRQFKCDHLVKDRPYHLNS